MEDIVVIGGGGHAKSLIAIISQLKNFNLLGFTDIAPKEPILGYSCLGSDAVIFEKGITNSCIGITYLKTPLDTNLRVQLFEDYSKKGLVFPVIKSNSSIIHPDVKIGNGSVIMERAFINAGTVIGRCVVVNSSASIDHDCKIGDFSIISPGAILCGEISIGECSFVGAGVVIRDSVKISDRVVIGAGSVVVKDILESGVYVGIPAKRIK